MDSFTPLPALMGGCLIGLAAATLWLANGRLAGISGMVGRLLPFSAAQLWRLVFILALVAGAAGAALLWPQLGNGGSEPARLVTGPASLGVPTPVWLVIAGLLTGVGTTLANGCTSGHGICGLARLSPRSFVAVGVFFGVAILTVTVTGVV